MDSVPRSVFRNVVFFRSLDFFDSFVNSVACSYYKGVFVLILDAASMSRTCEMGEN